MSHTESDRQAFYRDEKESHIKEAIRAWLQEYPEVGELVNSQGKTKYYTFNDAVYVEVAPLTIINH